MICRDARSNRRTELAEFLVSRRTRIPPESSGLPEAGRRRRTPGLRREEVSALAGISSAYYTWIEQGRTFDVSVDILAAIAGALQLSRIEAAHLFTLAGKAAPRPSMETAGGWRLAIFRFVRLFEQGPALVLTPWLDVLEANEIARETLGVRAGANLAEELLCTYDGATRSVGVTVARSIVALLRRNRAKDAENERFKDLIETLRARNEDFKAFWDEHLVDSAPLLDIDVEREGTRLRFQGVIVCDPVSASQFALLMSRSNASERVEPDLQYCGDRF